MVAVLQTRDVGAQGLLLPYGLPLPASRVQDAARVAWSLQQWRRGNGKGQERSVRHAPTFSSGYVSGPGTSLVTQSPQIFGRTRSTLMASAGPASGDLRASGGECERPLPSHSAGRRALLLSTLLLSPVLGDARLSYAGPARPSPLTLDDDELASSVFEASTRSVAAIILLKEKPRDGEDEKAGTGSGIVWDKFGHIVTNYHVISKVLDDKNGLRCEVALLKESGVSVQHPATVIGTDSAKDLAVLKVNIPPEELCPAAFGTSNDLRVGQSCFAVGNPYGYLHTLTSGVVSGLGRAIPSPAGVPIPGAIQTDASINSGNSGGPLLNSSGQVIGINTATFTRSGSGTSSGVNFAVPVDSVVKVIPKIIVYGTATRYMNASKQR